jgi:hypothetical protein
VIVRAVESLIVKTRKVQYRFAHGLTGNRAGVNAHPAHHGVFFNQRDTLSGFRRLNGGT